MRNAKTRLTTIEKGDTIDPSREYFLRTGQGIVVPQGPFGGTMLLPLGGGCREAGPPLLLPAIAQAVPQEQFGANPSWIGLIFFS